MADELGCGARFNTFTLAESPGAVRARNGLLVLPMHTLESAPDPHVLIVPGGAGTRALLQKPALLEWVRTRAARAEMVASVCTGALVLARAGLLHGLRATTHHENLDELAAMSPDITVERGVRFVDNGRVLTSAGISAGLEQSLHLVARLHGAAVARQTAEYMEYRPSCDART